MITKATHKVGHNAEYVVACRERILFQAGDHYDVWSFRVLVWHRHLHFVFLADL